MVITIADVNGMQFGSSASGLPDQGTSVSPHQPDLISPLSHRSDGDFFAFRTRERPHRGATV